MRVAPAPAQVRLEVWGAGAEPRAAALDRALGHLADADDDPAALGEAWRTAETPASIGAPRAAPRALGRRRRGRRPAPRGAGGVRPGLGVALRLGGGGGGDRLRSSARVQIDSSHPGLEEFWDAERPWDA